MASKKCFILCAGECVVDERLKAKFKACMETPGDNLVIAADGGVKYLEALGISADICIGDFDSVSISERKKIDRSKAQVIELPTEKDETDTLVAIMEGIEQGCETFYLLGALGGQLDHTLANLQCLLYLKEQGCDGFILDRGQTILMLKDECIYLPEKEKGRISIFAFGGSAKGVTIEGLEYEIEDEVLEPSFPLGVSNSFAGEDVCIKVEEGCLLVIMES
ncbi:MAG: thiamine diphosphokinase [Lachnospiraceae bacterium]|nr:thiamine diphosphokinase [Lachnospiraceae bacterium]MBQ9123146.1 thiamine diphosphokinase [Lachnospiraceae bacterium]